MRLGMVAAVAAGALVIGGSTAAATAAHPEPTAAHTAQTYNEVSALTVTTAADVAAKRPEVDDALAALAARQTELQAAIAQSAAWRGALGVAGGDLATLEASAQALLSEVPAPAVTGVGTFAELTAQVDALDEALASGASAASDIAEVRGRLAAAWTSALAAAAAATQSGAPHAAAETRAALDAAAASVAGASDPFAEPGPTAVQTLLDAITRAKAEESAWQQAEAARLAAEEAARQAAAQAANTAKKGSGGGSSSGSGGSGGSSSGSGGSGSGGGSGGSSGGSSGGVAAQDVTGSLLGLVNQARAEAGLGALSYDGTLVGSACEHSSWMATTGSFSHSTSGPWRGENIAYGYGSASAVFTAWMNSPGHRANILGAGYTRMGACVANTYWTQQFR